MHEPFFTTILSQEIARETRRHQFGNLDPDELYRDEMWDSLDSAPSLKMLFHRVTSFIGRRLPSASHKRGEQTESPAQPTHCAPQR